MEKAKIDRIQLFVLIVIFHMNVNLTSPLASGALFAILYFHIYNKLYSYYPTELPSTYLNKIVGNVFGKFINFAYIIYFLFLSARYLRHFGDLLLTVAYQGTPLVVVNTMMIILVIYASKQGIEVIARTALLSIPIVYLIFIFLLVVLPFSDIFKFSIYNL
jgi:spore germination protein KB